MKTIKIIILTCFLLSSIFVKCQVNLYKNKMMVFDSSISKIDKMDKRIFIKNYEIKIDTFLYVYPDLYKHIKIDKIKFNSYSDLPLFWNDMKKEKDIFGFYYGIKNVLNNKIILYTQDYEQNLEGINKRAINNDYDFIGVLLIINKEKIKNYFKVSSSLTRGFGLKSFLFNQYVIIIQTENQGYDVVYEGKVVNINYKYKVFEIKKNGVVIELNEEQSAKVKKRYLN